MRKEFIPVKVYEGKQYTTWYLDISKLKLSDLIDLRNELTGISDCSVKAIDQTIYGNIGYDDRNSHRKEQAKQRKFQRKTKMFSKQKHRKYK